MKKNLYSLTLSDDVVREVDALAHRMGTNRSALVNQILAEYVSVPTPERRWNDIFEAIEELMTHTRELVPFFAPGSSTMSLKSSLSYKYRPTVKYEVDLSNGDAQTMGSLNIVFNGVWSRQTDYFTAPNGMISVYGCGTAEGVQKFKISLWKKVDGGAEYVDNTTFYFVTAGQNYHCDIGNLDPNASYRLTISYDSSKYYLYGLLKVEGIG